jgi:hypothetical protein
MPFILATSPVRLPAQQQQQQSSVCRLPVALHEFFAHDGELMQQTL